MATVARAAPPTDPELKAIDDMLRAAEPSLAAAAKRSRKAVGEQATLKRGKRVRRKRRAARDALGAQRGELLGLRAKVDALPASTADAHNVKNAVNTSLTLFAESLEKQQRAIGARPETARKLLKEAEEVFLRSLASSAVAGKLLGREQS